MEIEWNKLFFSIPQLTCTIRQFRKFHFQMLKYHQDFVFFVDPFKFELHENLERTDIRNRSFILCTSNLPMQCKVFFYKILSYVTLYCVLCYITLHHKFNGHRLVYRSKGHAESVFSLRRKNFFFQTKIK